MKALDEAETRIRAKLPKRFRATYATKPVLTSCADWQIFEPADFHRTRGGEYRIAAERRLDVPIDAVVIGRNENAPLFLRFRNGALGESLWTWEDQDTRPTRVARSLDALFGDDRDSLERRADALLERGDVAIETSTADIVCPFCGSVDSITVDPSGGTAQTFVEDCASCCHPRTVHVEGAHVWVERG